MSSPPGPGSNPVLVNNNTACKIFPRGWSSAEFLPGLLNFVKEIKNIRREELKVTIDDGFLVVEVGREEKKYFHRHLLPDSLGSEPEVVVAEFARELFQVISSSADDEISRVEEFNNNVKEEQSKDGIVQENDTTANLGDQHKEEKTPELVENVKKNDDMNETQDGPEENQCDPEPSIEELKQYLFHLIIANIILIFNLFSSFPSDPCNE